MKGLILTILVAVTVLGLSFESMAGPLIPGKLYQHFAKGVEQYNIASPGYSDLEVGSKTISFRIPDLGLEEALTLEPTSPVVERIDIAVDNNVPDQKSASALHSARVTFTLKREKVSFILNGPEKTADIPKTPSLIVAFPLSKDDLKHIPVLATSAVTESSDYPDIPIEKLGILPGTYELPDTGKKGRLSDVLVTLTVRNASFQDVLNLLARQAGVSIVLDPYWEDDPTGGVYGRPPGGPGGEGGDRNGGGGGGGGFREGGQFEPQGPTPGTGSINMTLYDVPFDLALDMVIMSAGLQYAIFWGDGKVEAKPQFRY